MHIGTKVVPKKCQKRARLARSIVNFYLELLSSFRCHDNSIAGSLQIYAANVKLPVISRRVEHTYSNIMIDIKEPSRDVIQLPLELSFFQPESQVETVATIRFPYYWLSGESIFKTDLLMNLSTFYQRKL